MSTPAARIREALNAVYSGREGTCSYVLDGYGRTDALAALDALEQERDEAVQLAIDASEEAYGYGCAWPIGTSDEPQEQRGQARDTFIRNAEFRLAAARVLAGKEKNA